MNIGFFLHSFPVQSETFVSYELLELQRQGVRGDIWYEVDPKHKDIQPANVQIQFSLRKVPSKIFLRRYFFSIIDAHGYWLLKNPLRYCKAFFVYLRMFSFDNTRVFIKSMLVAFWLKDRYYTNLYVHESDRAFLYTKICGILLDIPVAIIFHTHYLFVETLHLRQKLLLADLNIFQSKYSLVYAAKKYKIPPLAQQKMSVISSPGVNCDLFKPGKRKKPFPSKTIIAVGRLEKTKGFHLLIQALSILKMKQLPIHLHLIGAGSQLEKLITLAKQKNVIDLIHFHGAIGHSTKFFKLLNESTLFVLPSIVGENNDRDMQPNAVKEAMAMEKIVVVSKLGGIEEVITDRENGFLLPDPNPTAIADKIQEIMTMNDRELKIIAKSAREKILHDFELKKTVTKLKTLLIQTHAHH